VTAGRADWRTRARRLALVCLALAAGSNSCTPVSPSAWAKSPYSLLPGDYTLVVYVPKGDAGKYVICVAENDVPDTVSIPVTVTAFTSGWRMTPVGDSNLGLVALLEMADPTTIYGPVLGQARDPSTGVVVTISPPVDAASATQSDAWLLGTMVSRNFAAGGVSGSVQFSVGGKARWCTPNSWILHAR
jgi:hypothetical protein